MFKKSVCFFLVIAIACSVCACSLHRGEQAGEISASTAGTQSVQSTSSEQEEKDTATTGDQKEKSTKPQSTTSKSLEKSSEKSKKTGSETTAPAATTKTAKKPTGSQKQATTKKQTTTKKQSGTTKKNTIAVSLTIECSQAVGKVEGVPSSGYFLSGVKVNIVPGENVYTALCAACEENGVSMVASNTMYGMYVSSIGGLAEKEVGKMSGWTYTVNGKYPPKACDKYELSDGDTICFIYKAG